MTQEMLEAGLRNTDKLMFSAACGSHAAVINAGLTAHRPNAEDDFNFGVVLTSRPIKVNEVFEVRTLFYRLRLRICLCSRSVWTRW